MKCKICNKEFKSLKGVALHIGKKHDITTTEYYLKFLGNQVYCKHCGKPTKLKNIIHGFQTFCNLYCCNKDEDHRKATSEKRKLWWKNSDKVEATKKKISQTVIDLWKDENSVYNRPEYKTNLIKGLTQGWAKWRENGGMLDLCHSYGFEPVDEYIHAHDVITFRCLKCKHEFKTIWNYLQSGKNCPNCFPNNGVSKAETQVYEFIKTIFKGEICKNTYKVIHPQELDIFIPSLMIAIEFNGLWAHSANCEWGGKDKKYHLQKTLECEKKNIRLIHIFSDEWRYKKEIVKARLKHILGVNNIERIYARKCQIQEISIQDKNKFLDKYHLQGKDQSQIKLGAYFNNELISVMTFSKGKISKGSKPKNGIWELNRFCSIDKYHIIGIAGKLLSHFKKNYEWKEIFSYSDRRWSDGNLYNQLGFQFKYFTEPSYWYLKGYKRIHRFSLRKTPNEPKNITEFELRLVQGYNWIWDCGNYKFSMINNIL